MALNKKALGQKHSFWIALVVALIMFNLGIFFGYMLEKDRINKINELYVESDINLLDIKAQSDLYELKQFNCQEAINQNIIFADKVYEDSKLLQKYEDASRITSGLILAHKKYDLLRTQIWINILKIKQSCNIKENTLIYLYEYAENEPSLDIKAKQAVFSRKLSELKQKYANKIILIPIAADNDFGSINILKKQFNITELPTILINEQHKIKTIEDLEKIENFLENI